MSATLPLSCEDPLYTLFYLGASPPFRLVSYTHHSAHIAVEDLWSRTCGKYGKCGKYADRQVGKYESILSCEHASMRVGKQASMHSLQPCVT